MKYASAERYSGEKKIAAAVFIQNIISGPSPTGTKMHPHNRNSTAVKLVWYDTYKRNKITGSSPTGTKTHPRTIPHALPTNMHAHHPPTTHRPSHYHSSTTAVEQYVSTNPQRHHSITARTTAVHLWYARSWVGFALSYDTPPSGGELEPPPTKNSPPTTHPPTNPPPQQYNSSGAVRTDQSTTTAQHYGSTHHSGTPVIRQELGGIYFALSYDSPPSGGEREPSPTDQPTTHHPPTDQPTTTAVQQWSSTYQPIHDGSTQQYGSTHHSGTPVVRQELRGIYTFLRFSTSRGRARAVTQAPTTHPPTNPPPQQYSSSGAVRTDQPTTAAQYVPQRHTCGMWYARSWVGFALSYDSPPCGGEREPSRETLFVPPACEVGGRRPLCCRGHRRLMCGAGVARACGR